MGLAVVGVVLAVSLGILRTFGLIHPYSVPTSAMSPAISPGDHIMSEGLTFLSRKPHRGDIAVFKTDGIAPLPAGDIYVKRIVGEPGDRLRITDGKLYVNDQHVALSNANGEIHYAFLPRSTYLASSDDTVTVPDGHFFVIGDTSGNSSDSRSWGFLPAKNITGRISFCYWPPQRVGAVR